MAWTSVIGGILGMAGSFVPAMLDVYDKNNERNHDLEVHKIDAELAMTGHVATVAGKVIDADSAETTSLLAHDTAALAGTSFIAKLSASVRPVITYCFFFLFFIIKVTALWQALFVQNTPVPEALLALWDEDTSALFAAILGFWFGSRAMSRFGLGSGRPRFGVRSRR